MTSRETKSHCLNPCFCRDISVVICGRCRCRGGTEKSDEKDVERGGRAERRGEGNGSRTFDEAELPTENQPAPYYI